MANPLELSLQLIRKLVEYQAAAGRDVLFNWPSKLNPGARTVIYALSLNQTFFETADPIIDVADEVLFARSRAAGLVDEIPNSPIPNWGPVFRLTGKALNLA